MAVERRRTLNETDALEALAHPVRLDVLNHLMAQGPATASQCARAVGDTPSNCSYHLRTLAAHGLVEPVDSDDGRTRPYRATVTGLRYDDDAPGARTTRTRRAGAGYLAASLQLDQRLARDYLARRDTEPPVWRRAQISNVYTVRVTAAELRHLGEQLYALIRPLLAATRDDAPARAELAHVSVQAFRRPSPEPEPEPEPGPE